MNLYKKGKVYLMKEIIKDLKTNPTTSNSQISYTLLKNYEHRIKRKAVMMEHRETAVNTIMQTLMLQLWD